MRLDPRSSENVHVSECDDDVDADVDAAKINLPSISIGSPFQLTS